jgi:hypothetical protein
MPIPLLLALICVAGAVGGVLLVRAARRRPPDRVDAGSALRMVDVSRDRLVRWRFRRLRRAGVDPGIAKRLAEEPAVDVHAVLNLVRDGCPAELAARIAEPIAAGGRARTSSGI